LKRVIHTTGSISLIAHQFSILNHPVGVLFIFLSKIDIKIIVHQLQLFTTLRY